MQLDHPLSPLALRFRLPFPSARTAKRPAVAAMETVITTTVPYSPVATGREESLIHPLHEPG